MTEAERKAAMEWLDRAYVRGDGNGFATPISDKHRATIKAMLAEPRLPKDYDFDLLKRTFKDWPLVIDAIQVYHRALYDHLTAPKTKFGVSVGMGWVHFKTLDEAMAAAKTELAGGNQVQIREVPA